jgi:ketosteroid isomerase-like protein
MSESNVAIVRGMFENVEAYLGACDPDIEFDGTNLPDGKILRGRDAVMDFVTGWAEMWENWEVELEEVIDAGDDRVIAFFRERGRSKAGLDVNERHSELYRLRDGKVVYRKGFSDADEVLVEAGLR